MKRMKLPKWLTVCLALASPFLGLLLFFGLCWLEYHFEPVRFLFEILQIIAIPVVLLLIFVTPWILLASLVRSGRQWTERHREAATLRAQNAQLPNTSLLRAVEAPSTAPDVLVRPATMGSEDDPQSLLRAAEK